MAKVVVVRSFVIFAFALILLSSSISSAQDTPNGSITQVCPFTGIQLRGAEFEPGGIILTAFDRAALWVYNVDSNRRYPLPDTTPCGANCRLSADARWITYFNRLTQTFNRMRLDGTERELIAESASDIEWWGENRFFVWTPGHRAYIQNGSEERVFLDVEGISSIQPNGTWALHVEPNGDGFTRMLEDMSGTLPAINLGADVAYFNAYAWSPDGATLAYVSPISVANADTFGSEIFTVQPGSTRPVPITNLSALYSAVRINGMAVGELSWSPDGTRIAFWLTPINEDSVDALTAEATIHVLEVANGDIRAYCGFRTTEHTPNPPRLIWSPDGTHLAFSGNVVEDERGYLILALNLETGRLTELSEGVYPNFGKADLVAWGLPPR
jgi:hypothetical protein